MRPHQLISTMLFTLLVAMGCTKSGDSINKIGTPESVSLDDLAESDSDSAQVESDSDSAQVEDEDVGKLVVGDKAPDFEIEVMGGDLLRFSSYFGGSSGPTVLLFDRAHW